MNHTADDQQVVTTPPQPDDEVDATAILERITAITANWVNNNTGSRVVVAGPDHRCWWSLHFRDDDYRLIHEADGLSDLLAWAETKAAELAAAALERPPVPPSELIEPCSKKTRGRPPGMARKSLDLIDAMRAIVEAAQPITGRGVGYQLFTKKLLPSMKGNDTQRMYRLLREAREQGIIPWAWIVDEGRAEERVPLWDDPAAYARVVANSYRRDFWNQQPYRVLVLSEKGTVRGVIRPVLDRYGVGFRVMHGFSSATTLYDLSQDDDGRPLIILYIGDFDCSGMFMSGVDLPKRFAEYGGDHIDLRRIALTREQVSGLPSFPATDKAQDPRYKWFCDNYGTHCWELDALDPNDLRDCVEKAIVDLIEPEAWNRCHAVNQAEQQSMRTILEGWARP